VIALLPLVTADTACVWAKGQVRCERDPLKHARVEVRLYDNDGLFFSLFKWADPDDHMGSTYTDNDGKFTLEGCGTDPNWFGIPNKPDPYIQIRHYCNHPDGEIMDLEEFAVYQPSHYDILLQTLDRANAWDEGRVFNLLSLLTGGLRPACSTHPHPSHD
jgi:hypothetical protein